MDERMIRMFEFSQTNAGRTPYASACIRLSGSFTDGVVAATLPDAPDLASAEESNERMELTYKEIDCLVGEIIFLVDLLFADHGVAVILPGEAA
jgi:hypothetical protein